MKDFVMKRLKAIFLLLFISTLIAEEIPFEECFIEEQSIPCSKLDGYKIGLNPDDYISCFTTSKDGRYLAAASRYGVVVYDIENREVTSLFSFRSIEGGAHLNKDYSYDPEEFVQFLQFSPDNNYLVARRKRVIVAWNLETRTLVGGKPFDWLFDVFHVITNADGRSFILGEFLGNSLMMLDIETREVIAAIDCVGDARRCVFQEVEGHYYIAYHSYEGYVGLFDVEKKECIARRKFLDVMRDNDGQKRLALCPNGRDILIPIRGESGHQIVVWNTNQDSVVTVPCSERCDSIDNFVVSPDGKSIVVNSYDDIIRHYNLETFSLTYESCLQKTFWAKKQAEESKIQFSPDGKFILSYIACCLDISCA